ncbi:MAG TPA: transglycosylase SLT domain-containing protein [Bryobacteraceae bacterium]|nr:transglycosylase SLT domain-containing protein [Bryobacteraceae bacterium]
MAKITPALCFRAAWLGAFLALALVAQASRGAPSKSTSKKVSGKKAAKPAPPKPAPAPVGELAALTQAYRTEPSASHRAALEHYAAAHARERNGALARLALGVGEYEGKDYAAAAASLKAAAVPQLADYAGYYLAEAQLGLSAGAKDPGPEEQAAIAAAAARAHGGAVLSPLSGKAWLVQARSLKTSAAGGVAAVRLLREHYAELPQPEGDLTLADCYQASGDPANAADYYQRVYYRTYSGDAAERAAAALASLKESMGASYPEPLPRQMLQRADGILASGDYRRARTEYEGVAARTGGVEHELAAVGAGAARFLGGDTEPACAYLRGLSFEPSEGEAERLYYMEECARRENDDAATTTALGALAEHYAQSPWRLKALVSAANRYLIANRPDDYIPLYREAYDTFPNDPAASTCHWKVAFHAWMAGQADAAELLREHLRKYGDSATAGAALYFLGRAAERDSDFAAARADYERLAQAFQNTYYAVQARMRLRRSEIAGAAASPAATAFLNLLKLPRAESPPQETMPETAARLERSRLLRTAGLADLADAELRFGARNGGQTPLLGMELAGAAAAPHQALHIMKAMTPDYLSLPLSAGSRAFWDLLFPLPYRSELFQDARAQNLDPYFVAGLIRQESEFDPQARSRAAALGLTQVLPVTGRQFARQAGLTRFSSRMLYDPAANLKIGMAILRTFVDKSGGELEAALAAYNAGPDVTAKWLSWNTYREPAEFVESVPYTETREYIQAVLRNADVYRRLYGP